MALLTIVEQEDTGILRTKFIYKNPKLDEAGEIKKTCAIVGVSLRSEEIVKLS